MNRVNAARDGVICDDFSLFIRTLSLRHRQVPPLQSNLAVGITTVTAITAITVRYISTYVYG